MSSNEIGHHNHHHHNGDYNDHNPHSHHHHELIEEDSIDDELDCQIPDIKEFDPKIRDLLDDLNRYSTKINQLEQCFQVFKIG